MLAGAAGWAGAALADSPAEEWTFQQVEKCWQPMTRAVQHVGVPGYQFQAGVMWDGALVFGPLDFRQLKVMQQELAPLGNQAMHMSVGFGERMRLVDRRGTGHPAIRRSLEGGRLPIPHVLTRDGDLVWHETVFAHLPDRPPSAWFPPKPGDILVVHAVFRVRNAGYAKRTGGLWLHFGDTSKVHFGYKCEQLPALATPLAAPLAAPLGASQSAVPDAARACKFDMPYGQLGEGVRFIASKPDRGELVWHDVAPQPEGVGGEARGVLQWRVPLAPSEEAELHLTIPYGVVSPQAAKGLAAIDARRRLAEVVEYWTGLENGPGQIVTPDPFFNDYLSAVVGQMAQQVAWRERSTGVWMYKTSPNHYEGYWPCNAAKALPVLGLRGLGAIKRRVLGSFVDVQTDDVRGLDRAGMGHGGALMGEGYARRHGFLGNFGEWTANPLLISHGLAMWALAGEYRTTRDEAWLRGGKRSPLSTMLDGFDWVTLQRRRTMREIDGKRVPYWGLLPAASAHDWLSGNTVFNDAYCIYGMTEVVRLLREIGHPRAEPMARELAEYRQCLNDRYREARDRARPLPLSDGTKIPYVPRMVQELDWAKPDWTYTGYSALRAGAFGVFDPRDPLTEQSLSYLEAGMPKGEGAYFSTAGADNADVNVNRVSDPKAERHYLWRHYVEYETMWPVGCHLFLARDDLPRFFEWLFHNMAYVVHRDFRVGVESSDGVPSCAPGEGERWLAIRGMLVREFGGYDGSGESLWLLQAVPRSWLRPGDRMEVRDMATWFGGRIHLAAETAGDGRRLVVRARWHGFAVTPKEIRVRLRSGDGRPLVAAEVNGKPAAVLPGDVVLLPAAREATLEIVGRFR